MNRGNDNANSQPRVLTRVESHDKILKLLDNKRRGKILDVPCGEGALASKIKLLGFDIHCCDIDTKLFRLDDIEIKEGNLNEVLPYSNELFDYIICVAGLHRIHRLGHAINEFYRLLVPGGELIVSFPNYANFEHRLKFLFTGSLSKSVNRMVFHQHFSEHPDAHFRHLLLYPQLYFALESVGFETLGVFGDKFKRKSLFLSPFIFFIMTLGFLAPNEIKTKYRLRETTSTTMLLGGNNLIVTAKRPF